nr:pantoate--beta-alanine ligase [uncultured Anaeromusa sp.]
MKQVTTVKELRQLVVEARLAGQRIALVPTMGYLHAGHCTLMQQAKKENAFVVASIFVNPLQFGVGEDFAVYPRDLERDAATADAAGVDVLFAPSVEEMYPQGYENMKTLVTVSGVSEGLCGASRPGHFQGVATVVAKLFHLVQPDRAYFGQKDAQQVAVIRQMAVDLNWPVDIVAVPIVREADGLALSSRNLYLSQEERSAALVLSRALQQAKTLLRTGERRSAAVEAAAKEELAQEVMAAVEYVKLVDATSMQPVTEIKGPVVLALAVRIGKTRLIDNLLWEEC